MYQQRMRSTCKHVRPAAGATPMSLSLSQASSDAQEANLLLFVNSVLAKKDLPRVSNLREDLSSGSVLIAVLEILSGKTPANKYNANPRLRLQKIDCVSVLLDFMAQLGVPVIGLTAYDVVDCNAKRILGLVNQIHQQFRNSPLMAGNSSGREEAASQADFVSRLSVKLDDGARRRSDTMYERMKREAATMGGDDAHAAPSDAAGGVIADGLATAVSTPRGVGALENNDSDDVQTSITDYPSSVPQAETRTMRSWKRFQQVEKKEGASLDTYAERYRNTDDQRVDATEAADDASLPPDVASAYSSHALRIVIHADGAAGAPIAVPVWLEPTTSYADVVRQLDARIRHALPPSTPRLRSNARRPWSAPLVVYVATEARGLIGCLADLGDELLPHTVASALIAEGEVPRYEYRVLADDVAASAAASDAAHAGAVQQSNTGSTAATQTTASSMGTSSNATPIAVTSAAAVLGDSMTSVSSTATAPTTSNNVRAESSTAASTATTITTTAATNARHSADAASLSMAKSALSVLTLADDSSKRDESDESASLSSSASTSNLGSATKKLRGKDDGSTLAASASKKGGLATKSAEVGELDTSGDDHVRRAESTASGAKRRRRKAEKKTSSQLANDATAAEDGGGDGVQSDDDDEDGDADDGDEQEADSDKHQRGKKSVKSKKRMSSDGATATAAAAAAVVAASRRRRDEKSATTTSTSLATTSSPSTPTTPWARTRNLRRDSLNVEHGDEAHSPLIGRARATGAAGALDEPPRPGTPSIERTPAEKEAFRRNEVAREIFSSERKYVSDGLDVLIKEFLEPLRENGLITKDEVKYIFGDVEAIRNYNTHLLEQLGKRMDSWDESGRLGDIFLQMTSFLKMYTMYVNKYNNALETLVECRANKPKFAAFLERVQSSEKCAGRDIGAFLILPIQRIPRYVMLLQELLKNTPAAHSDRAPLEKALVEMRDVADYVNERKREAENLARVTQVSKLLTGKFEAINAPHRRFVRQAALGVAVSAPTFDAGAEVKPLFVVLFNDMLVFGKTGAKLKREKGKATMIALTDDETIDEQTREHKYLGRVMLQYYGVVDGQALTATGAGGGESAGVAAAIDEWDIGFTATTAKKKNATLPDIASHCIRLEPLLKAEELPLEPDTAADGFPSRAVYCFYFASGEEKLAWMTAFDETLCQLNEQAVSRRLEAAKVARLHDVHADAVAAFAAPDKKGTLLKRDAKAGWPERMVALQGATLYFARPNEAASNAHSIDLRTATMRAANCKHFLLLKDELAMSRSAKRREESDGRQDATQRALSEILRLAVNQQCHDCSSPNTNWISTSSGAVLCDACAAVHVQLPVAVAAVRSISLTKWDEPGVYAFRQANLAVLKRVQAVGEASDAIVVAASGVVGKQLTRPAADAEFEERAAYIARLYCSLASARRPTTLAPLDAIDGFLYRRVASNSTWRRETFRLRGTSLVFDKQKALSKQTETISLVAAEIRPFADSDHDFSFELLTPTRIFQLAGDSDDELSKWVLGILSAIAMAK